MSWTIAPALPGDAQHVAQRIEAELLGALAAASPQGRNAAIVLAARGRDGALVGGVTGATSYGWVLIKTLWVCDDLRGRGIGTRLMTHAEDAARQLGCHSAWLDTSSAPARAFYQRLGYADFGMLRNAPGDALPDHARWFLQKRLD